MVFDALNAAEARGIDVVIVDTAGRLHTKTNLMDELGKVARVIRKKTGRDPETLLVVDANTGQNGLSQAKVFAETIPVEGLILTKLDGTAKGGIVVAIAETLGLPVRYVGMGETGRGPGRVRPRPLRRRPVRRLDRREAPTADRENRADADWQTTGRDGRGGSITQAASPQASGRRVEDLLDRVKGKADDRRPPCASAAGWASAPSTCSATANSSTRLVTLDFDFLHVPEFRRLARACWPTCCPSRCWAGPRTATAGSPTSSAPPCAFPTPPSTGC